MEEFCFVPEVGITLTPPPPKSSESGLQILSNLFRQLIRIREVVEVGEGIVFEPEDVKVGFVAGDDLLVGGFAPMGCSLPQGSLHQKQKKQKEILHKSKYPYSTNPSAENTQFCQAMFVFWL